MRSVNGPGVVLIEVDFQPWILAQGTNPGCVQSGMLVRRLARADGAHVFTTRYLDPDPGSPHHDPHAEQNWFADGLAPTPGDVVLTKSGRDVFENPDVIANLEALRVGRVLMTGALTDFGVRYAALSAVRLGLEVAVVAAACTASSEQAQESTLVDLANSSVRIINDDLPVRW